MTVHKTKNIINLLFQHGKSTCITFLYSFQYKKPTILQQKQVPRKPYRQAITPSPPKTRHGSRNVSRPQTSLGLYNEKEATVDEVLDYSRPKSAFGNNNERVTKLYNINR